MGLRTGLGDRGSSAFMPRAAMIRYEPMNNPPVAECEICGKLPDDLVVYTGRGDSFPDAVTRLVFPRTNQTASHFPDFDVGHCPACEALFQWENRPQFYGSGNLDEEQLTRLSNADAELVRPLLSGTIDLETAALELEQAFSKLPYRVLSAIVRPQSKLSDIAFEVAPTLIDRVIRSDDRDWADLLSPASSRADRAAHILELLNADPRPKGTVAKQLWERCAKIAPLAAGSTDAGLAAGTLAGPAPESTAPTDPGQLLEGTPPSRPAT